MLKKITVASFVFASSFPALVLAGDLEGPSLLMKNDEVVGIITVNPAFTDGIGACTQLSGTVKVEGLQFSDSGKTLKSFYFEDSKGNNWSVPTGFERLNFNNIDEEKANNFIKKGRSYFVRLQACGSGGFVDLLDIYAPKAMEEL
ncbi:hypothetical protein NYO12_10100 [Klebsiella variicola]|uniref:hypothetical protein n=1 Tax=Klebsiella variicola TaxID=244366 RepID=UPI002168DF29|nr:hypothetical protein [Klebsiella variicola]UVW54671.1 hypothetical protein NYO12_10100 [Klebsiella variicola]